MLHYYDDWEVLTRFFDTLAIGSDILLAMLQEVSLRD